MSNSESAATSIVASQAHLRYQKCYEAICGDLSLTHQYPAPHPHHSLHGINKRHSKTRVCASESALQMVEVTVISMDYMSFHPDQWEIEAGVGGLVGWRKLWYHLLQAVMTLIAVGGRRRAVCCAGYKTDDCFHRNYIWKQTENTQSTKTLSHLGTLLTISTNITQIADRHE